MEQADFFIAYSAELFDSFHSTKLIFISPQLPMNFFTCHSSLTLLLDRSPAFQTSDEFVKSNEIFRTKCPIT